MRVNITNSYTKMHMVSHSQLRHQTTCHHQSQTVSRNLSATRILRKQEANNIRTIRKFNSHSKSHSNRSISQKQLSRSPR